jgi:steroid 5-alpha reductase family enzyme
MLWWSVWAASIPLLSPIQSAISIISPSFITFLLLKVSGIPLLEVSSKNKYGKGQHAKEYEKYIEKTPDLIPFLNVKKSKKDT